MLSLEMSMHGSGNYTRVLTMDPQTDSYVAFIEKAADIIWFAPSFILFSLVRGVHRGDPETVTNSSLNDLMMSIGEKVESNRRHDGLLYSCYVVRGRERWLFPKGYPNKVAIEAIAHLMEGGDVLVYKHLSPDRPLFSEEDYFEPSLARYVTDEALRIWMTRDKLTGEEAEAISSALEYAATEYDIEMAGAYVW